MKTNRIMAGTIAAVLAAGLWLPQPAAAGRREWATAGKILTGAAIVTVLHQATRAPAYCPPVVEHRTVVVHAPPPVYVRPHGRPVHYAPPPARPSYGHRRPPSPRDLSTPIIVQTGGFRRLYQPRIQGHPSFIQEWCRHSATWITVGSHPSVW